MVKIYQINWDIWDDQIIKMCHFIRLLWSIFGIKNRFDYAENFVKYSSERIFNIIFTFIIRNRMGVKVGKQFLINWTCSFWNVIFHWLIEWLKKSSESIDEFYDCSILCKFFRLLREIWWYWFLTLCKTYRIIKLLVFEGLAIYSIFLRYSAKINLSFFWGIIGFSSSVKNNNTYDIPHFPWNKSPQYFSIIRSFNIHLIFIHWSNINYTNTNATRKQSLISSSRLTIKHSTCTR